MRLTMKEHLRVVLFSICAVAVLLRAKQPCDTFTLDFISANQESEFPHQTPSAQGCSKDQLLQLEHQLWDGDRGGWRQGMLGELQCPRNDWISHFYNNEADIGSTEFIGISVGCNKGEDAIRTARMGLASSEFDVQEWMKIGKWNNYGCQPDTNVFAISQPKRTGEMHCIEPLPNTFSSLKRVSNELNLDTQGLVLTNAAIGSSRGTASFPSNTQDGDSRKGLGYCKQKDNKNKQECTDFQVPVYSLEQYVDKYVKTPGAINVLQIDVEGWDFDVLFGASSVLDRTHYIEFEYHQAGNWGRLHITDAVRLLDGKGFTCYWTGQGKLWQITECYLPFYETWHGWSNVACVHRNQIKLSKIMDEFFRRTVGFQR
jgi:FkbM family methyltransferase